MLESLTIHQIALIDDVTIHFHQGMHALTGETGAGTVREKQRPAVPVRRR